MQDFVLQKQTNVKKRQQFMIEGAPMQGLYFIYKERRFGKQESMERTYR
jgi:hypothetical protein